MSNHYFETLAEIRQYLEKKYAVVIAEVIPAVNYETMESIRTDKFFANIYRMPSGRYELVDYAVKTISCNEDVALKELLNRR